jgi:mono/diheme cytochrome c family protein
MMHASVMPETPSSLRPLRLRPVRLGLVVAAMVGLATARAELTAGQRAQLPPPATVRVDFAKDIQPIFEASCVQCHARGKDKGSFSLETRADFLEGGDAGPPAVAGKSAESTVIAMISGLDPENGMP